MCITEEAVNGVIFEQSQTDYINQVIIIRSFITYSQVYNERFFYCYVIALKIQLRSDNFFSFLSRDKRYQNYVYRHFNCKNKTILLNMKVIYLVGLYVFLFNSLKNRESSIMIFYNLCSFIVGLSPSTILPKMFPFFECFYFTVSFVSFLKRALLQVNAPEVAI